MLCAVFVPTAFISGLTGQFYKQFAITIAISTVISAFNSLTLSPALCAVLLKDHHAPKDWCARAMDKCLGWFFRPFNRAFAWAGARYGLGVGSVLRKSAIALVVYGGLVLLTGWSFNKVPTGFVPTQDKQYLVAFAQLPDGASLDRTEAVIRRMSDIGLKQPGRGKRGGVSRIEHQRVQRGPEFRHRLLRLKPFEERKTAALSGPAIAGALNQKFALHPGRVRAHRAAAAGHGPGHHRRLQALRRRPRRPRLRRALSECAGPSSARATRRRAWPVCFPPSPSTCRNWTRTSTASRPRQQGVPLQNLFETMQIYLGSLYVNDFNRFGRTYKVIAQAELAIPRTSGGHHPAQDAQ